MALSYSRFYTLATNWVITEGNQLCSDIGAQMVDNSEECALAGAYFVAQGLYVKYGYQGTRVENGYPGNCYVYLGGTNGFIAFNEQSPDYSTKHPAGAQVCK